MRLINWIWHVRGEVALPPGQSRGDALDRLDPLFRQYGTSHERTDNRLSFRKKDQAAQDKMSVFDSGVLRIENGSSGPALRYHLISRALLFCFLMPPMFLAIAQLTIVIGKAGQPSAVAAIKAKAEAKKKEAAKKPDAPMNVIDKALGAPAPEKKKDDKDKDQDDDKPKPTAAYVLAALFAILYLVGRVLEAWLVKKLFKTALLGA